MEKGLVRIGLSIVVVLLLIGAAVWFVSRSSSNSPPPPKPVTVAEDTPLAELPSKLNRPPVNVAVAVVPWAAKSPAAPTPIKKPFQNLAEPPHIHAGLGAPVEPDLAVLPWDQAPKSEPQPLTAAPSKPPEPVAVAALPWELDANGAIRPVQPALPTPSTRPSANSAPQAVASNSTPADIPTAELPWKTHKPGPPVYVMSMCRDLQGYLWIGTEDEGVCRYDPAASDEEKYHWFTTEDGLGDDNGYAVACDRLGRIWVGHLNHGVSVYNGQKWQCYEIIGGLPRDVSRGPPPTDTLSGPLGERVFAIAVCPTDGDVWIATNAGLSRYSEKLDNWSYYTRADGLPSDQVQCLTFDADGNLYVGTQCDGIAMADAKDDYKTWHVVTGPDKMPTTPVGDGLPTNLINYMLVARNGTVYAGTTTGLAYSHDRGKTWNYWRGRDYADKVRGLYGGPPKDWHEEPGAILAEDYLTCLTEADDGSLYLGFRRCGWQHIDPKTGRELGIAVGAEAAYYVNSILVNAGKPILGTYGNGWQQPSIGHPDIIPSTPPPMPALPSGAKPMSFDRLQQMAKSLEHIANERDSAEPRVLTLEDDWRTEGAWLGRYGRYWACLNAVIPFGDYLWGPGHPTVSYSEYIGPHHDPTDSVRYWVAPLHTTNKHCLELPAVYLDSRVRRGSTTWDVDRRQAMLDDHGEAYPAAFEGPNLYFDMSVPAGSYVLSLYFRSRNRDYSIFIRNRPPDAPGTEDQNPALWPCLVRARVRDFSGGVYKRFLVHGPKEITVEIDKAGSLNTMLSAVFLDTLDERPEPYYFKSDQATFPSLGASVEGKDGGSSLVQTFDRFRSEKRSLYLTQNRLFCSLMARAYVTPDLPSDKKSKDSLPSLATCYYRLQLFPQTEACQKEQGILTSREIERALRWEPGKERSPFDECFELVTNYRTSHMQH